MFKWQEDKQKIMELEKNLKQERDAKDAYRDRADALLRDNERLRRMLDYKPYKCVGCCDRDAEFDAQMLTAQRNKIKRLEEENAKLKQYNENQQDTIRGCLNGIIELRQELNELNKKQESDKVMTLGEFDKEMERIADRHGLDLEKDFNEVRRRYKFISWEKVRVISGQVYPEGWNVVEILLDDFCASKSYMKKIERKVVDNCVVG